MIALDNILKACKAQIKDTVSEYVAHHRKLPSKSILDRFNKELAHVMMMYIGWAQEEGYKPQEVVLKFAEISEEARKRFDMEID